MDTEFEESQAGRKEKRARKAKVIIASNFVRLPLTFLSSLVTAICR